MKTKDGYSVKVGDWVSDFYGIWEIKKIDYQFVTIQEVLFNDDGTYEYDNMVRSLTHTEFDTTMSFL